MGDGGSANDPGNRAQNLSQLLGKILRIDIDQSTPSENYVSPPTNPFYGSLSARNEIYAIGMRNPWRFSVDRLTGEIYAGDVGQGQREEVDIITRAGNFGWRVFEGTRCTNNDPTLCNPANYIPPITEYSHTGGRCSITGGYVYRGTRSTLPYGSYIFADYCSGEVFLLRNGAQSLLLDTTSNISSFGEDDTGELYVVGLEGTIYRITNPSIRSLTNVSAANYRGETLAADSVVAAFGSQFATTTEAASSVPLPLTLAGTQVMVRDATGVSRSAPLFYVSPQQVNYHLPAGIVTGRVEVIITSAAGVVSTGSLNIQSVSPGMFSANANGSGIAAGYVTQVRGGVIVGTQDVARLDTQSGSFVARPINLSATNDDMVLTLFGTGFRHFSSLSAIAVTIGGIPQSVEFAGPQGTFVALDQLNVRLSRSLAGRGTVDIVVTVDGITANTVTVTIN